MVGYMVPCSTFMLMLSLMIQHAGINLFVMVLKTIWEYVGCSPVQNLYQRGGINMDNPHSQTLDSLIGLLENGTITEIEAERLLNAATRYTAGVPTGINNPQGSSNQSR